MKLNTKEQPKIRRCDICEAYYMVSRNVKNDGKYSDKYAFDFAFVNDPENNKDIKLGNLSIIDKYTISQIDVTTSKEYGIRTYVEECDVCPQCMKEFHKFIKNRRNR